MYTKEMRTMTDGRKIQIWIAVSGTEKIEHDGWKMEASSGEEGIEIVLCMLLNKVNYNT